MPQMMSSRCVRGGALFALVLLLLCFGRATPARAQTPPEFAGLYSELSADLDAWQTAIGTLPPPSGPSPAYGAHVLAANSNRGTALLNASTLPTVDLTLDRLKELNVAGVTVSVSFPLLNADFPNSAAYMAFYQTVAQHVRARGLALTVEQHIAFHDTPFSTISFDFSALPFTQFESEFHAMSQLIIDNMHPDYLTLLSEPDTFGKLTGYTQASTPAGAVSMVETVAAGLQRGTTKIGAGSGSWLSNAVAYATAFAASSMDYVDLHIYPVDGGALTRAQGEVDAAHAAAKPVLLDEVWLYKIGASEPPPTDFNGTSEIFKRDNFSFWSPLDVRFLTLTKQFARANHIAYVAPFWTTFFWGDVDYGPSTQNLTYAQLLQLANQAAYAAMQADTFTAMGQAWRVAVPLAVGGVAEAPIVPAPLASGAQPRTAVPLWMLLAIGVGVVLMFGAGALAVRRRV